MKTYAILRRGGWTSIEDLQEGAVRSTQVGRSMADRVRWIRSYAIAELSGELGTVCIYLAEGPNAIREHAQRAFLPCDEIVPVVDTMIVRPDRESGRSDANPRAAPHRADYWTGFRKGGMHPG